MARRIDGGHEERRTMANINVVNLGGKKVGEFELADEVFAGEINDALLWESVKHYRAALRQGTAATKNRKLGLRRRQEALEAEGNRPRSRRLDPHPALAWWWYGSRTEAPQLRVRLPAEEADGRTPLGYRCEDR